VQLDSQEFEVLVTADIGPEAALALIQATRGKMSIRGQLRAGGNPAQPEDWHTRMIEAD
jgi:hypothetical protein